MVDQAVSHRGNQVSREARRRATMVTWEMATQEAGYRSKGMAKSNGVPEMGDLYARRARWSGKRENHGDQRIAYETGRWAI